MKTSVARREITKLSDDPGGRWGDLFDTLATNVHEAIPPSPKPLSQDAFAWPSSRARQSERIRS